MSTTADMNCWLCHNIRPLSLETTKDKKKMCAMCIVHNTKAHIQNRFQTLKFNLLVILLDEENYYFGCVYIIYILCMFYACVFYSIRHTYLIKFQSFKPLDMRWKIVLCSFVFIYLTIRGLQQQTQNHTSESRRRIEETTGSFDWN